MNKRPSFEHWCMEIAKTVSLRSPDPKLKVGAILVSEDFKYILGWGYNGSVTGQPNERKSLTIGQSGFIHAELNCLLSATTIERGNLFVTTAPCEDCARIITNSGKVSKVYYNKEYRNKKGLKFLEQTNTLFERI